MTERHYYHSDALQLQAQVLACQPLEDGNYALELDATLFHPQGGGQPADGGTLNGEPLLRLVPRGEDILHVVARPQPPGAIDIEVDGRLRVLHARWHSAGHLIGYLGETQGWRPVKAHHWPGEGRITFMPGDGVKALEQAWRHKKPAARATGQKNYRRNVAPLSEIVINHQLAFFHFQRADSHLTQLSQRAHVGAAAAVGRQIAEADLANAVLLPLTAR